MKFIKLAMLA